MASISDGAPIDAGHSFPPGPAPSECGGPRHASGSADREGAYRRLVALRKQCRACPGLANPSTVAAGSFDLVEVGPYTLWHGDLQARLVVVAKDFAPEPQFIKHQGRPGEEVKTNRRLQQFLELAGFQPGAIGDCHNDRGIFMTNSVLCLPGGQSMRTRVGEVDVKACATTFLREILHIVRPRVVASLGNHALRAVMYAHGQKPSGRDTVEARSYQGKGLPDGSVLFAMPHPVASKSLDYHKAAWRRVKSWFDAEDQASPTG